MVRANIEFVRATQKHIDAMKGKLREFDAEEYKAVSHRSADERLQFVFDKAVLCWVVLVEKNPVICWGVSQETVLGTKGVPWLLATDGIHKVRFSFLRRVKEYAKYAFAKFDTLETWVDTRDKIAVAFLKWYGFTTEEPAGSRFCKFRLVAGGI